MLMPYYIRKLTTEDYGTITYFYSVISILLVLLTFGMETGFFKFAKTDDYKKVLSTSLSSVGFVSLIFLLLGTFFLAPIQSILDVEVSQSLIFVNILCLSIDAFTSIIFAKLRYESNLFKYLYLRVLNVLVGLFFTYFFLDICVDIYNSDFNYLINWFYTPSNGVFYSFLANLLGSVSILFFISKDLVLIKGFIDSLLLKRMLIFSLPMLGIGIAGMINMNIDKILLPKLLKGDNVLHDLGVYGANFKLGLLMAMFAQSFRMAFEPFCFKYSDTKDINKVYADVLKYFTIFGVLIFLVVTLYIDFFNLSLTPEYRIGNAIIPVILVAQLFNGMFYSQSLWYKLSDKPIYGLYLGLFGVMITLLMNIILVPIFGYIGSAWAELLCYLGMVVLSLYYGHKFYPIYYDLKSILFYIVLGLVLFFISTLSNVSSLFTKIILNSLYIFLFIAIVIRKEHLHIYILRYVNRS